MTYQEEEQSGGKKMRMKKVARPVRKPARAAMTKPKKAPARKRVFHSKLLKHFGGFFSELEGFAEQMSKAEQTPAKKANFTNGMPMPKPPSASSAQAAQAGGRRPRRKVLAPKKKVVRKSRSRSLFGGADEEEFGVYNDALNAMGAVADGTIGRAAEAASTAVTSGTSGGARRRVRRVRRASPARSASPVRRRRVRRASPRY